MPAAAQPPSPVSNLCLCPACSLQNAFRNWTFLWLREKTSCGIPSCASCSHHLFHAEIAPFLITTLSSCLFFTLLLHPSCCSGPWAAVRHILLALHQQELSPPRARQVERVQKEMGKNGHSTSQLPAEQKLQAQKQGGNHPHPPWLIAVGAAASAIIWRKDPVHNPGEIRSDLMETCEATRPHFLTWGSKARSAFCSVSVSLALPA